MEGQAFTALAPKFEEKGVQILGISADSTVDNKAFKDKHSFTYSLLSDPEKSIPSGLAIDSKRWAILIDGEGKVSKYWGEITDKAGFPEVVLGQID